MPSLIPLPSLLTFPLTVDADLSAMHALDHDEPVRADKSSK